MIPTQMSLAISGLLWNCLISLFSTLTSHILEQIESSTFRQCLLHPINKASLSLSPLFILATCFRDFQHGGFQYYFLFELQIHASQYSYCDIWIFLFLMTFGHISLFGQESQSVPIPWLVQEFEKTGKDLKIAPVRLFIIAGGSILKVYGISELYQLPPPLLS